MLRGEDGGLNFVECSYAAVESLMVLVHDDLEGVLELFVSFLELVVLVHQTQGALVVELECNLDGYAGL